MIEQIKVQLLLTKSTVRALRRGVPNSAHHTHRTLCSYFLVFTPSMHVATLL